jgi:hypothetical protein
MGRKYLLRHQPDCPYEYAWDVAGECHAACTCKHPYPFKACFNCYKRLTKRHDCERKAAPNGE